MKAFKYSLMALLFVVLALTTLDFIFFDGLLLPLFGILVCIFVVMVIILIEIMEVKGPRD